MDHNFSFDDPPNLQDPHSASPTPPPESTQVPTSDPAQMPFLPPPIRPGSGIDYSIASTPRGSAAFPNNGPGFNPYGTPRSQPSGAFASNNDVPLLVPNPQTKETYGSVPGPDDFIRHKYSPWYKRPVVWFLALGALAAIIVAVVVPVYFTVIKPSNRSASGTIHSSTPSSTPSATAGTGGGGGGGGGGTTKTAITGGDGSTVTMDDGSTFVYHNSFGGFWVDDPNDPFNDNAQPNSWSPPLNTSWKWGQHRVFGVNLGGLFVLEPFISPALFQLQPNTPDEWTLSQVLSNLPTGNNLSAVMEEHYSTFITEEDIAQIAGAGLNWIRLPVPFWAIETWADVGFDGSVNAEVGEPFLAQVCWKYILRIFKWARKYGIRINLDLHTIPGSQNGYNHSGRGGQINFLNGPMGIANAQRALDYIRIFTEFISQPQYSNVVPMFSIVNEALISTIGMDQIQSFYLQAYNMIRGITGVGEGNGPYMTIHDGFDGLTVWSNFLSGGDRIGLDTHPYFAFDGQPNGEPVNVLADGGDGTMYGGQWPKQACQAWGSEMNTSRGAFGVTIAGEFSNAINDCGLYIRGFGGQPSSAANCNFYSDASQWDANTKNGLLNFALASMDALGDWFFWTWKIGNSSLTGQVNAPLWSYQLGLENGWMPTDPRQAVGMCAKLGAGGSSFGGSYQPYQTGGSPSATPAVGNIGTFPPTSIAGVVGNAAQLPVYTPTKSLVTLPGPTFTPAPTKSVSVGGWFDSGDTSSMVTAISGCRYPIAWSAVSSPIPTGCGGNDAAAAAATPLVASSATSAAALTTAPGAVSTSDPNAAPTLPPRRR